MSLVIPVKFVKIAAMFRTIKSHIRFFFDLSLILKKIKVKRSGISRRLRIAEPSFKSDFPPLWGFSFANYYGQFSLQKHVKGARNLGWESLGTAEDSDFDTAFT
jgi:hypothetical protein